nr:pterin-4-alpha-carbinolamine dehydratase 2, mitochondrial-like isoform X1 [Coffea arabica]
MLRTPVQFQARLLSLSMAHASRRGLPKSFTRPHGRSNIQLAQKLQGREELTSFKHIHNGFRAFCSGTDLTTKKCVSCNAKDMRPMTVEAAHSLIPQVQGWNLVTEDGMMKLQRTWKVKTFMKGMEFFKLVADVAEAEGHHPDLHLVAWNNVKIEIWTHAVGGLTENDFILAAKINRLDLHQLLSRKVGE